MTNQEKRERRSAAAQRAAATRRRRAKDEARDHQAEQARQAEEEHQADEPFSGPQPARMDLVRRARALGLKGEARFWRRVQELRASHRPADWTAGQVVALDAALAIWEAKP